MKIHGGVDLLLTEEWFIPRRGPVLSFVDLFKIGSNLSFFFFSSFSTKVRFSGHKLWDSKSSSADSGYEVLRLVLEDRYWVSSGWRFHGVFHDQNRLLYDKVTVLESEKRAWETSPEALAVKEALNPWRKHDEETGKSS
ncbi:hypothetical protein LWI28_009792 [Acer negundo]|uniref:Uncharacterized protein n=1 Tax=Acer negundo TaxID=4023 RepID=A0AAD5JDX0_ACENE|nr:hypothetical protein LWI28_009792 [Acer negundo]